MTVTEVFSLGKGDGGQEAGRSVPGCGCSRGGRSGSGGPRVERDRGNSDALDGGEKMKKTLMNSHYVLMFESNFSCLVGTEHVLKNLFFHSTRLAGFEIYL